MKHGQNPETCEMRDQGLPALGRGHDHIKHVVTLSAFSRDDREPGSVRFGPGSQFARVVFPDLTPHRLNLVALFELCAEEGREQVRRQITRADIDPVVFVDFAAKKSTAIRSLFPEEFQRAD